MNEELFFTKTHEWIKKIDDTTVLTGISEHAAKEMGDIVFINLPDIGKKTTIGSPYADVESVKAVSEIYSPVEGIVTERNSELSDHPENLNASPYDSWIAKISDVTEFAELMDKDQYEEFIK